MTAYHAQRDPGDPPHIIAHRGISAKAPENTLAAFRPAVEHPGIAMIELDVRISRDGIPVVIHDRTLQRTSTGNGAVRNYSVDELKSFDAGSWFHRSFAGERIPTLREVLTLARNKCWVNIELKGDLFFRAHDLFVRNVINVVAELEMQSQVLYSSFAHELLATVRHIEPSVPTGVIYNFYRDFGRSPSKLAHRVGASVFVCARRELRKAMIRDARQHSLALYIYTLNSVRDAQKMQELGIDGIISDNADDIAAVVRPA
ncbi:MAG TPA: glycerophosphodiester phosphodiesterase family protein [Bacteroidota bacterium]